MPPTNLEVLKEKIGNNQEDIFLNTLPPEEFRALTAQILLEKNTTRERQIVLNFLRQKRGDLEKELKERTETDPRLQEQLDAVRRRLGELEYSVREHIGQGASESIDTVVSSAATTFDSGSPGIVRAANAGILGAIGLGLYGAWRWFHRKTVKTEIVGKDGKQEIVEQKESIPWYLLRITGLLALGTGLLYLVGRSKTQKDIEAIKKERAGAVV